MFTSVEKSNNYEQIVSQIKEAIVNKELQVGDQLPSETILASDFSVSRSSVREALKSLQALGIVESKKGGGNYVVNNLQKSMTDNLSMYFILEGCSVSHTNDLRISIELGAVREIVLHGSDEDIALIKSALDVYLAATNSAERIAADIKFHETLILASHNPFYALLLNSLSNLYSKMVALSEHIVSTAGQIDDTVQMHKNIYEAIYDRDFVRASAELYRHFDFTDEELSQQEYVMDKYNNPFDN